MGSARSVVEVVAVELGPSLRWATATPVNTTRPASDTTVHERRSKALDEHHQISARVTGGAAGGILGSA